MWGTSLKRLSSYIVKEVYHLYYQSLTHSLSLSLSLSLLTGGHKVRPYEQNKSSLRAKHYHSFLDG